MALVAGCTSASLTDPRQILSKAQTSVKNLQSVHFHLEAGGQFLFGVAAQPTDTPTPAPTKSKCTAANRDRLLALAVPASLGGLPILTVPVPLASGLSGGLQIILKEPRSPVIAWALDRMSC